MSRVGWIRLAVIALAVGLLEFACRIGWIDHRVVIPPSEMTTALVRLLVSGQANDQILRTFGIVIAAVAIAVVAGFALGLVIHVFLQCPGRHFFNLCEQPDRCGVSRGLAG